MLQEVKHEMGINIVASVPTGSVGALQQIVVLVVVDRVGDPHKKTTVHPLFMQVLHCIDEVQHCMLVRFKCTGSPEVSQSYHDIQLHRGLLCRRSGSGNGCLAMALSCQLVPEGYVLISQIIVLHGVRNVRRYLGIKGLVRVRDFDQAAHNPTRLHTFTVRTVTPLPCIWCCATSISGVYAALQKGQL